MKQGIATLNFPLCFHFWKGYLEMTISFGMSVIFFFFFLTINNLCMVLLKAVSVFIYIFAVADVLM